MTMGRLFCFMRPSSLIVINRCCNSLRFFVAALVILPIAVALYWQGLHGGFFFDDEVNILLAKGVRLESLSLESIRQALASGIASPSGRPVAQLSFALNYYVSGFDPFVFKATNLLIHVCNSLLVFFVALRLLTSADHHARRLNYTISAGFLAVLWLLHPIQTLPVLHVVQRMTSLSAFFLLSALLLHLKAREPGRNTRTGLLLLAWGVLWPLSFLCKESGLLFPLFALAWELILRRSVDARHDRFTRTFAVLFALVALVVFAYCFLPNGHWLWRGYEIRSFSLSERLLTEGRVLWFYLGLILFPRLEAFGVQHDDLVVSSSLITPWTTLPALIGLLGLVWTCWILRRRLPLVAFGIAWFLIGHLLESTALPLEIAHEHRNYLPLLGVLLILTAGLIHALGAKGAIKTLGITLATAALLYLSFITAVRSHQFGEEIRRTQTEAQHHRTSPRAQYEAGRALSRLPESTNANSPTYSLVRSHYEQSGELDANFKFGLLGLIHLNCNASIPVESRWTRELARRLRETPFAPGDRSLVYNLKESAIAGTLCLPRKDVDSLFTAALENPKLDSGVQSTLLSWHADYLWLHEYDLVAAQDVLGKSLELNPGNPSNRLKWAQLVLLSGKYEQARRLLINLKNAPLSPEERITLSELLTGLNISDH